MTFTRITSKLVSDNIVQNLNNNNSKLFDLQQQLSTGNKVNKPSDDPDATMTILTSTKNLSMVNSYTNNINQATSEMNVSSQAITSAVNIVTNAKQLAVEASNGTMNSDDLQAIATQIDQMTQNVVNLGNTQYDSKYIFGGLVTSSPPYSQDGNGNIIYNGTSSTGSYQRQTEISPNVKVTVNTTADAVFGQNNTTTDPPQQSGLINTLQTLSDALKANPPDQTTIRTQLNNLDQNLTTLQDAQATLGGTLSTLSMTQNQLANNKITYTQDQSNAQSVDIAQVVSNIQLEEQALQASVSVAGKILTPTLLDTLPTT